MKFVIMARLLRITFCYQNQIFVNKIKIELLIFIIIFRRKFFFSEIGQIKTK